MSYYIDNNNFLITNGIIDADDYNAIIRKYNSEIGFNHYSVNTDDIITAYQMNDLLNNLRNYTGSYNISLPNNVNTGDDIVSLSFGPAIIKTMILRYTNNANYTIPGGCYRIRVNVIQAAGGGGGGGIEYEYGQSGGSGGSGGYQLNQYFDVNPGDNLNIVVGQGGTGTTLNNIYWNYSAYGQPATNGGDSYIQVNGNTIIYTSGGGAGTNGNSEGTDGIGGKAGYPNGNQGYNGIKGASHHTGRGHSAGVQGASSYFGPGGSGGDAYNSSAGNGGNASNYGAGGGSGANVDGAAPNAWAGGNGGSGYIEIQLPV